MFTVLHVFDPEYLYYRSTTYFLHHNADISRGTHATERTHALEKQAVGGRRRY